MVLDLYIKQKVFSIGERFTVTDGAGRVWYTVRGSVFELPKTFRLHAGPDESYPEVASVTKKTFSFLPHFSVIMGGREVAAIDKEFTFFKDRYRIDAAGLEVEGDWWDMDFQVTRAGTPVARISEQWFTWGDSYKIAVYDETYATLVIALVIAIDCVKADEQTAANAAAM
ncbi:LURP-one-related/scramblase family protein [Bifidobacterium saguinibicoloris]|uniref:LURP-one-related/scramblase family protein n=1 Tax=Bifidobacterium saguinibicoloris TaxID=2834433 RepID=UPI001C55B5C9|nr:LURP-one-related family protein [Bifidobacterium saguinibicoloris]MBW3080146.1 LURP-one-related family protein [Bifidobacterium saguinibicoloris]